MNGENNVTPKRKSRQPNVGQNIGTISALTELQLVICKQLQKSLDIAELLDIYTQALQSVSNVTAISFIPTFQTLAADKRTPALQVHFVKLFTGQDYIGQLKIEFATPPSSDTLAIAKETASLVAFPLSHAMEYEKVLKKSELDTLTNLKNRKAMSQALLKACDTANRHGITVSILMFDIDTFKKINDSYGHVAGDKILQRFATIIQQSCRLADEGFRYGGDEFLMLLPNTTESGASQTAERLRKSIEINDFGSIIEEKDLPVTISIGISTYQTGDSIETFMEKTDQALYAAKQNGRNRSFCFSALETTQPDQKLNG